MRAIHVSVRVATVRGALSHCDHGNLLQFFIIIIQTSHDSRFMHGIYIIYMLMLRSMTLTSIQGHSGSPEENNM